MSTYLFITKEEYEPELVASNDDVSWSCSKTTRLGDTALVYVAGIGVCFEWRVLSDAEKNDEWPYVCDVEFVKSFDPPITIQELRSAVTREEWKPPHLNFRGWRSITIPADVLKTIRTLRQNLAYSLKDAEQDFAEKVAQSLQLSAVQRRSRLKTAKKYPDIIEVTTTVFIRNPDVVAEVLNRAKGHCESCGKIAPFERASNGTPYLEVHHRVRLADNGEDSVENAIALCPNCHRKAHFG